MVIVGEKHSEKIVLERLVITGPDRVRKDRVKRMRIDRIQ